MEIMNSEAGGGGALTPGKSLAGLSGLLILLFLVYLLARSLQVPPCPSDDPLTALSENCSTWTETNTTSIFPLKLPLW